MARREPPPPPPSPAELAVVRALRALVLDAAAAPSPAPKWTRIDAEARARGFSSTRAFRSWCLGRGVEVRESSARDTWVRPADVDSAVAALPLVRRTTAGDDIDAEIDRSQTRPRAPRHRKGRR